jgi:hypothetical protein
MLREKIRRDPKIGDSSHKDDSVVNRPFVVGVAGPVILGIALLMPVGVSNAVGESLISDKPFAVSEPEFMEVSEPEFLIVSEPKILEVSELKFLKISEPKSLEPIPFPKGKYTPPELENPAYDRCAKEKGFDDRYQCALKALGTTQE